MVARHVTVGRGTAPARGINSGRRLAAHETHAAAPDRVQQDRAIRTRESLVKAAAEVFEQLGYGGATIELIASQARATKGAVYFHFASKGALAEEVVSQQHAAWADLARSSKKWGLNGIDTIERLIAEVARSYATNPLMRAGVRLANEQEHVDAQLDVPFVGWIKRLTALLRLGQRDGSVNRDVNCAAAARAIVASFYGIEEVSARLGGRRDLDRRVQEWWRLLRPGLAASVGGRPRTKV